MEKCDYVKNSNEPCDKCPRAISMLYKCDILQEIQKEAEEEESLIFEPMKKVKIEKPKAFCKPDVIKSFACMDDELKCTEQCKACKFVEKGLQQANVL